MRNQKTPEQWIDLINRRPLFEGSNIDYCKKHNISVKMFYKKRVQFAAENLIGASSVNPAMATLEPYPVQPSHPSGQTSSRFIRVPSPERSVLQQTNKSESSFTYNTKTGLLTLPASATIPDVIELLRGLAP